MPSAEERFRAKLHRRGNHIIWTGFIDNRGVGMVRINGKLRTVQRAAWEFAYGPLSSGARVNSCGEERACVRVEHLSLASPTPDVDHPTVVSQRRARGTGSIRELRAGVWQVTVNEGATSDGRPLRRYATAHGDRDDAETALAALAAGVRRDLGDLRVRELVDRYLHAHHDRTSVAFARDREVLHRIIEPHLGDVPAVELTDTDIERALVVVYREDGSDTTRHALGLLRDAYRWARRQRWTDLDPTAGITLRHLR